MSRAPWYSTANYRPDPAPLSWSWERLTVPSVFPVTRDQARINCRAGTDPDEEDTLYNLWIRAATFFVEAEAKTFVAPCSVKYTFSRFPYDDGYLFLSPGPVRAVTAVNYTDEAGDPQAFAPSEYQAWLAHNPPLLSPVDCWPSIYANSLVTVTADVGYATAELMPAQYAQAVLVLVTLFETRRDLVDKNGEVKFPGAVRSLAMSAGLGGYG